MYRSDQFVTGSKTKMVSEIKQRSYFFAPDTMEFFGTSMSSIKVFGKLVMVGTDRNAPEGCPKHWVRVFRERGEQVDAQMLGQFETRGAAEEAAKAVVKFAELKFQIDVETLLAKMDEEGI